MIPYDKSHVRHVYQNDMLYLVAHLQYHLHRRKSLKLQLLIAEDRTKHNYNCGRFYWLSRYP